MFCTKQNKKKQIINNSCGENASITEACTCNYNCDTHHLLSSSVSPFQAVGLLGEYGKNLGEGGGVSFDIQFIVSNTKTYKELHDKARARFFDLRRYRSAPGAFLTVWLEKVFVADSTSPGNRWRAMTANLIGCQGG